MRKILILFFFILISKICFANVQTEKYVVEKPDGSVVVVHYFPGSSDTIFDVLRANGFEGLPTVKIKDSDILASREDRKYWKRSGDKIIVDQIKKQKDLTLESQQTAKKEAVLGKLKISEQELKDVLNGLEK